MWPASVEELVSAQLELGAQPAAPWHPGPGVLAVGACVVVFERGLAGPGARGDRGWAAAAVLHGSRVTSQAVVDCTAADAYAPGLLALREGPCLEAAVRALAVRPDVLLVDASGRDHPRRAGMALHLGAVLDLPTVGVTHRPLEAHGVWPEDRRGACESLHVEGEQVGAWVRTRVGARPLAVHPAWRTDLETAVNVVLAAAGPHRTPEPFRHARRLARTARAGARA